MRLICPNCDAQYDIADDVIPEGGRDVQCSSCTHTWFQTDKPKVAGRTKPILTPTPTPAPKAAAPADDVASPATQAPARKPLDSSIADILREEAAREHDVPAPAAKATGPQTDAQRADETRRRVAQMTEEAAASSPASVAAAATGAVAGGNLRTVPGIDEINATLRARAEASDTSGLTEAEKEEAVQRRGFRRGFAIVLVLIALAIAPYFFAQDIVEKLPQTRGFMTQYVETVNTLREQIRSLAGQAGAMIEDLMPTDAEAPLETAPTAPETSAPSDG